MDTSTRQITATKISYCRLLTLQFQTLLFQRILTVPFIIHDTSFFISYNERTLTLSIIYNAY